MQAVERLQAEHLSQPGGLRVLVVEDDADSGSGPTRRCPGPGTAQGLAGTW
jgi:hypothetical protein